MYSFPFVLASVVLAATASAIAAVLIMTKRHKHLQSFPAGLVAFRARRRMPAEVYLDLSTRFGRNPCTVRAWMAEKMIAGDASKLAEMAEVTIHRVPDKDEYEFELTLIVAQPATPADPQRDAGGAG